jgi:Transposase, Mutator family
METEVSGQIGAAPYERSSERTAYRNGYRTRTWDTRVGTIELKIPKVTAGTYFPSLLEPRRRAEKALQAVVVEAYVKGISTRKVDPRPGARQPAPARPTNTSDPTLRCTRRGRRPSCALYPLLDCHGTTA